MPECDSHQFCFVYLGEEHAALALKQGECEHYEGFPVKVLHARLAYFLRPAPTLPSWGSRMELAEEQETGMSLSLALSPDLNVLLRDPKAFPGVYSVSLASAIDFEIPVSERYSHNDKAYEELLDQVTARPTT